jgi:TonB-dependent SusC/RagA subfamily outer membrane receptor
MKYFTNSSMSECCVAKTIKEESSVAGYAPKFNNMIMKKVIMIWFGVFLFTWLHAQEKTVKGIITTFNEIPVMNVLILVKSSSQKFYSDSLGLFSIQCSATDKLTISAEGFIKHKIRIKKKTTFALINMRLKPVEEAKDLAIGYGHVKDKDKLYAMSSQDESEMNFSHYRNIYDVLTGNFTGVQIINGEVLIRNSASFKGSTSALLIVDGRELNSDQFANIETSDIAQINILKDASASVYGVKGANGVVIVVTKRGR